MLIRIQLSFLFCFCFMQLQAQICKKNNTTYIAIRAGKIVDTNKFKKGISSKIIFCKKDNTDSISKEEKKDLENRLLQTKWNLENPDLRLFSFYEQLWGTDPIKRINEYIMVLNDTSFQQSDSNKHIKALLQHKTSYEFDSILTDKYNDKILNVYRTNVLKSAIIDQYNADLKNKNLSEYTMSKYLQGWRNIETLYSSFKSFRDSLKIKIDSGFLNDGSSALKYQALSASLEVEKSDNKVIEILKSGINTKWFWIQGGIPAINIFNESSKWLKYPENEPFRKKEDSSVKKMDTILRMISSDLKSAKELYNQVELSNVNKWLNQSVMHLDYDSIASNMRSEPLKLKLKPRSDTSIVVNLHNAPRSAVVTFELDTSSLPADNAIVDGLNEGVSLLTTILPASEIISSIVKSIGKNIKNDFKNLEIVVPESEWNKAQQWILLEPNSNKSRISQIFIEGQLYTLSGNWQADKLSLITEFVYNNGISLSQYAIKEFLRTYKDPGLVNYVDGSELKIFVDQLFKKLIVRIDVINASIDHYKSLVESSKAQSIFLEYLVNIPNRDLPVAVEIVRDTLPIYQTLTKEISLGELKKTTLKIIKKENGNPNRLLYYKEIHRYKWQMFDVSAGLAFNYHPNGYNNFYYENTNDLSSLKNSNPNFAGIAGLHIYPFKINRSSQRFFTDVKEIKHRFSVYLGVNFMKPLKHFHPGISIDLVPGIKWINGVHVVDEALYTLSNNVIVREAHGIAYKGCFTAICIDPGIFSKLFSIK